jgi:hypothetical protein
MPPTPWTTSPAQLGVASPESAADHLCCSPSLTAPAFRYDQQSPYSEKILKWPRYLSIRPRRRGFVALSGHAPRRVIAGVPGRWLGGRTWLPGWDRRTR